jgi:hypothetical protein
MRRAWLSQRAELQGLAQVADGGTQTSCQTLNELQRPCRPSIVGSRWHSGHDHGIVADIELVMTQPATGKGSWMTIGCFKPPFTQHRRHHGQRGAGLSKARVVLASLSQTQWSAGTSAGDWQRDVLWWCPRRNGGRISLARPGCRGHAGASRQLALVLAVNFSSDDACMT